MPHLSNEACDLYMVVSPDWDLDLACQSASKSCADGRHDGQISSHAEADTHGAE